MRDRLIELIERADEECKHNKSCEDCSGFGKGEMCMNYHIADYLIANGVIVPPCKVGDTVYEPQPLRNRIQEYEITTYKWNGHFWWFTWVLKDRNGIYTDVEGFSSHQINKAVFLTREEAEAALAERGKE